MNRHQMRRIANTFRHVDGLLGQAVAVLGGNQADSPFSDVVPDAAPIQQRVIQDYARRVRGLMCDTLRRMDIPLRCPGLLATWEARTHILGAGIDIEEIEPRCLSGHGPVSVADARTMSEANAEIQTVLAEMAAYLGTRPGANFDTRLARLDSGTGSREQLGELARLVTAYGLATLRPSLELLMEEADGASFDIAVFGRVKAGKSSLLNHVLGRGILPVGVTPATSLVTRITCGTKDRVRVQFSNGESRLSPLAALTTYVTGQENPHNCKRIASIQVDLASSRIPDGITCVDTPGLGSLSSDGTAETMAYLPRADLGLVLVDANTSLSAEDVRMVEMLVRSGARAVVLLSKADLLAADDRALVLGYTRERLAVELGFEVPVHLASVIGADAQLADRWIESILDPLLASQVGQRAGVLAAKTERLRMAVLQALRGRSGTGAPVAEGVPAAVLEAIDQTFHQIEGMGEGSRRSCVKAIRHLAHAGDRIQRALASKLVKGQSLEQVHAVMMEVLEEPVQGCHNRLMGIIAEYRQNLLEALGEVAKLPGGLAGALELPHPFGLPVFGGEAVMRPLALREPFLGYLHPGIRKAGLIAQFRSQIAAGLKEELTFHARDLEMWCRCLLAELERTFHSKVGPFRVLREEVLSQKGSTSEEQMRLERDLRVLETFHEAADARETA